MNLKGNKLDYYERKAVEILEKKGFTNIRKVAKRSEESFDLTAENEGIKYCIEVKGTGQIGVMGRYIVPSHELKALYMHYLLKDRERALLMFVDDYNNYCIFQMVDGFMA